MQPQDNSNEFDNRHEQAFVVRLHGRNTVLSLENTSSAQPKAGTKTKQKIGLNDISVTKPPSASNGLQRVAKLDQYRTANVQHIKRALIRDSP